MKSWLPGDQIAIRGVIHNRVWIAHPVTVVQDTSDFVAAYLVPGALCKVTRGLIERKWGGVPNGASRWDEQEAKQWEMADHVWRQRRALIFLPPEKHYAVYWFWEDETDTFTGWYVNFQLPFHRTAQTLDTLDLEIDLIIRPDGSWRWKDEEEYWAGVRRGSISAEVAAAVAAAQEEALQLLTGGSPLFDRRWLEWRPDPHWSTPSLPDDWQVIDTCS